MGIHDTIFIYYGNDNFDPGQFCPVINYWNKPRGGLWLSPKNSAAGWVQWCKQNDFQRSDFKKSFCAKVRPGFDILIIDSPNDMRKLPVIGNDYDTCIDFQGLLQTGTSGVYLTEKGLYSTHLIGIEGLSVGLYGWDCESLLLLTPDCVEVIADCFVPP